MAHLLSCIGSLLFITLQWEISSGYTMSENKTLQLGDKLILASPSFPVCCTQDFKVFLKCSSISCGFSVLFLDVDLPSVASLIVQSDPSDATSVIARAQLEDGVWSRPSFIHKGKTLFITLSVPYQKVYPSHSGVKLKVHAYNTVAQSLFEADETSVEQCGKATLSSWKGGEIKLTPKRRLSSILDCIWLLKKPYEAQDANAFVRFTYTHELHGILAVRNGTSSAAPALLYFDTNEGSTAIMHGREGFTSPNDLYVRMRKPIDSGYLTYVYGLFTRRDSAEQGDECSINGYAGYYCADSKWCIPILDRCDQIKHCPRGEDEDFCDDFEPVTYKLPTTTTMEIPTTPTSRSTTTSAPQTSTCKYGYRKCKDGSCASTERCPGECDRYEKMCPDKSCVQSWERCPGECSTWQKKCKDGSCVSYTGRCPGECRSQEKKCPGGQCIKNGHYCPSQSCPSYKPNRCGYRCYYDSERCDDNRDCDDGSDERDCPTKFKWYIILIVLAVAVVLGVIICIRWKSRQADEERLRNQPAAIAGVRNTRGPVIAGARRSPVIARSSPARRSPIAPQRSPIPAHYPTTNPSATARNEEPTVNTPLADPSAPPSYTDAMDTAYNPPPTSPMLEEPAPPPYESVAAAHPPNQNSTSPV